MLSSPILVSLTFFISLPLVLLFSPQFLTTSYLPFTSDTHDHTLFRRASVTAAHTTTTTTNNPKIAFLFLTNSNLSFAPLWEKFFSGHRHLFNIYIHADPSSTVADPGGVFRRRFIPSKKTNRASPSLISAARRLLASALIDDPHNQYFALVSQHCVPLLSFRFVYSYLFCNSIHSSFIEILSNETNLYDRYVARGENAMLPEVPYEEFRVGSQFFVLARNHAAVVVRDKKLWRKFRLPCVTEEPCYPEEHYFPTLLSMEDRKGCTGFTLTRVNWTGCWDGHPHLYTPSEVSPGLIRRLRVSNSSYPFLFARKFSPECLAPLMEIADDVIFRD
ncbi:hypothetical protein HN51_022150 [Arachis hypogaea]|uniref:glycosyltransferase BC10 n=1 Tax=Arachis hypogaea TaxID=3818 RepID=UPI000DEC5CDC|nr:glycosyltransferase BC10 [Arachis hypogaea]QHO53309.1 uncharacterized protein DS421_2g46800 [Arachis hypogaea]QHO53310.1 uncharacterized protein DS421_2g46800 [Arachis hypogaea]